MHSNWQVSLKIRGGRHNPAVVRHLREVISSPVSEINAALQQNDPIPICILFTKSHDSDEKALLGLVAEVERLGVAIEIYVSGKAESKQYLLNILQRHRETSYDTQMETDLELGENSEEAKAWASGTFRHPQDDA